MEICTSYFAMIKHLKKANYIPISIARNTPPYYGSMLKYEPFAPSDEVRQKYDKKTGEGIDEYIELYKKQIREYHQKHLIQKELLSLVATGKYNNKDFDICNVRDIENIKIVLLCYEKPPKFCHRQIVQEYFEKVHGYQVKELGAIDL